MAEEYYYIEEISQNLSEIPLAKGKAKRKEPAVDSSCQSPQGKRSQEIRLHEIEQQLEMAESRCNTLKGQVDYMKMLYNGMNNGPVTNNPSKSSQQASFKRDINAKRRKNDKSWEADQTKIVYNPKNEEIPSRDVELKNQTISNVSTIPHRDITTSKDASEAVKSINNIISGITNSVNRLTQLQVNIANQSSTPITSESIGIQNIECLPRAGNQVQRPEKPYQTEPKLKHVKSKDTIKKTTKKVKETSSKRLTNNKDDSTADVNEPKKKVKVIAKLADKKTKLTVPVTAGGIRKKLGRLRTISSRTLLAKKSVNLPNNGNKTTSKIVKSPFYKPDKLIELYHNSNVKIRTASDDSIPVNKKSILKSTTETKHVVIDKTESIIEKPDENIMSTLHNYKNQLSPIDETEKFHYGSSYYKNYELPTIASKMKQVARTYFENFSFRTIPFVAARSITPSHNLGVNIQQVLSIIKGRKPVAGISPTLAYNIELAANKLGSKPLSCLVSTLGSRMNNRLCPLSRRYPNMSHLQELAKEIPEETIEELNEEFDKDGNLTPLAAGDKVTEEKKWAADPNKNDKCTCLPKQGVGFNDIYNKYVTQEKNTNTNATPSAKRLRNRPWNANNKFIKSTKETLNLKESKASTINRKERSLKEILKNLYDEFAELNERYDDLKTEVNKGTSTSNTLLAEIEKMENILQNKEDEITMVMSLYKEVLALKQQVKVLKKRASQSTVLVSPFLNRQREYKEMNAAGHLTKLLRHIQQFQGTLKNKTPLN